MTEVRTIIAKINKLVKHNIIYDLSGETYVDPVFYLADYNPNPVSEGEDFDLEDQAPPKSYPYLKLVITSNGFVAFHYQYPNNDAGIEMIKFKLGKMFIIPNCSILENAGYQSVHNKSQK